MSRDQKFFDMYSIVLGVSAVVLVAFFVVAMKMADLTQGVYNRDTAEFKAAVAERIRPVGQVYLPGDEHQATAPNVETTVEPEPVATALSGPQVYNAACNACHGTGAGGAPVVGDADAWASRIAQGTDVLNDHAVNGFSGEAMTPMLPKGGRPDLSDQEIYDAVAYMVSESQ